MNELERKKLKIPEFCEIYVEEFTFLMFNNSFFLCFCSKFQNDNILKP